MFMLLIIPISCGKHRSIYSENANTQQEDDGSNNVKELMQKIKPFRMKKTNLMWAVARKVSYNKVDMVESKGGQN